MSKSTEAMKKAITTTGKAEDLLKDAQKEIKQAEKAMDISKSKASTPARAPAKPAAKTTAKASPQASKPAVKSRPVTLAKKPTLRESVKKAQSNVTHKTAQATTDAHEVTIKVEVNTNTPPWENGSTVVSVSTPKLPETTLVNQVTPARAKPPMSAYTVKDNVRNTDQKPARPTNYAVFGSVGQGFSKN